MTVRVLLINPSMNLKKLGRFAGLLEPMPCIGLAYIAAALEQHGCQVRVIDMFAEGLGVDDVVNRAASFRPELIGMTVLTPSAPVCSAISQQLRRRVPEAKIVWGGVHADVFGPEIVRSRDADFAVHGDGEITVCELVDAMSAENGDFAAIDGLTWVSDGVPVTNKARAINQDLDSLPYPAWHLFPYHRYGLLPFADFAQSAACLDMRRLQNQRTEARFVLEWLEQTGPYFDLSDYGALLVGLLVLWHGCL